MGPAGSVRSVSVVTVSVPTVTEPAPLGVPVILTDSVPVALRAAQVPPPDPPPQPARTNGISEAPARPARSRRNGFGMRAIVGPGIRR